jgi:hypothetical protein
VRCGRCGNENEEGNRFCGMCGVALVMKDQAGGQARAAGATGLSGTGAERLPASGPPSGGSTSAGSSSAGSSSHERSGAGPSWPVISGGPSLLGLNLPGPETGSGRGDGGRDPLRPSSNVDYLLDDVEEPRRSWGKVILIVAALALAVGFGYLHWRRGDFDWLTAGDKKPTAAATDAAPRGADSGGATTASGAGPQAGGGVGGSAPGASAGESGGPQAAAPMTSPEGTPSQSAPVENTPAQAVAPQAVAPQSTEQPAAPASNAGDSGVADAGARADADAEKESAPAEAKPRAGARKPAAAIPVAPRPVDSVTEAERYIYGRGVGQDCDHGLRLLKPAAAQSNVTAMISLGALYSTGTCTPRDLPTAYRWFALALHKEPDNQALQNDLQNLWGKMTQPERQLAIKLSQ